MKYSGLIGYQKAIDDCFTVDMNFKNENFVLKAIKCLTNFVNEENSAKP